MYRLYSATFEKHGSDTGFPGLAFFSGVAFIVEGCLILAFGVGQRLVEAVYIDKSIDFTDDSRVLTRLLVPFAAALLLTIGLTLYLGETCTGRPSRRWCRTNSRSP